MRPEHQPSLYVTLTRVRNTFATPKGVGARKCGSRVSRERVSFEISLIETIVNKKKKREEGKIAKRYFILFVKSESARRRKAIWISGKLVVYFVRSRKGRRRRKKKGEIAPLSGFETTI